MLYQLPNGKVVEISTEQYFQLSDEELEYLMAFNYGEVLEDPWFGSVLTKTPEDEPEIDDPLDFIEDEDLDIDFEDPN